MKRIILVFLACSLLLSACTRPSQYTSEDNSAIDQNEISAEANSNADSSADQDDKSDETIESSGDHISTGKDIDPTQLDITIKGLDDEALLTYVEGSIYLNLISELGSEDYVVEGIEAVYYPKEYIEALSSNTKANVYFGYTAAELDAQFQGKKYVFTLGEDGQTEVVPMETVNDDVYVKALEDVIIGAGAILVCVTVSLISAPLAPAVSAIFLASATTGTTFALKSGAIGFITAAIVKGYETESLSQAIKAGAEAAGEGFKWGAITGIAFGGGKEAFALKKATKNGLSMNQVAKIQQESGFPLDLIEQIKSMDEYNVYKNAGSYPMMVNGKLALVRGIDPNYVSELQDGTKVTNLQLMKMGRAPIEPATGKAYQLHHINQEKDGTLVILTAAEHQGNSGILNTYGKVGVHNAETGDKLWDKKRVEFWKGFAKKFY